MKIGIESQRIFRSARHGMDVVAMELIRQFQQMDNAHQFILFARNGPGRSCIGPSANLKVELLKGFSYGDWEQYSLPKALKKYAPDLIHCTANTAPVRCPLPLVLTLHDIIFLKNKEFGGSAYQNFGNLYRRWVVPKVAGLAKAIITVSETEKKSIVEHCRIDPEKVRVIYNGVDTRFSPDLPMSAQKEFRAIYGLPQNYILHLGNTAPKKNTPGVIRSYLHYCSSVGYPLPIVIADYPLSLLKKILEKEGMAEMAKHFILPGYIPVEKMPLLYRGAALFLYPSLQESFGLPVLEAMAVGVPAVVADIPALREIAGDAAVFTDPYDIKKIAAAMEVVLRRSVQEQYEAQKKGLARASQFSWKNSADTLVKLYEQVLSA